LSAIAEARGRGLARLLSGLGIRHIGASAAKTIARHFPNAAALLDASVDALMEMPDFGEITAPTLHEYLHSKQGREMFQRLQKVGVDLRSPLLSAKPQAASGGRGAAFAGKTVVLTGT